MRQLRGLPADHETLDRLQFRQMLGKLGVCVHLPQLAVGRQEKLAVWAESRDTSMSGQARYQFGRGDMPYPYLATVAGSDPSTIRTQRHRTVLFVLPTGGLDHLHQSAVFGVDNADSSARHGGDEVSLVGDGQPIDICPV